MSIPQPVSVKIPRDAIPLCDGVLVGDLNTLEIAGSLRRGLWADVIYLSGPGGDKYKREAKIEGPRADELYGWIYLPERPTSPELHLLNDH